MLNILKFTLCITMATHTALAATTITEEHRLLNVLTGETNSRSRENNSSACEESRANISRNIITEDVEALCSEVVLETKILNERRFYNKNTPGAVWFITGKSSYSKSYSIKKIQVSLFCKPRTFSDSALISLAKKCQADPQEECFKPEIMQQLNQVKPTLYKKTVSGNC